MVQEIAGTAVSIRVRAADDPEDLAATPWVDAAVVPGDEPPVELGDVVGHGALLGVEVLLQSVDRERRPVVERVAVHRSCSP